MKVKVIARQGAAALVEWVEPGPYGEATYRRSILPSSLTPGRAGEIVDVADPDLGAPGGEAWEELLMEGGVSAQTSFAIANELRRLGIWTLADLQARQQDAVAAFQKGYGMDVQRLRLAAANR